ncbi:MAG: helix-turn-helix transcriptional regulator [Xanthobacteraceae bacterium]
MCATFSEPTENARSWRRVLRDKEVAERTRLSRVQRWRRVRNGTFPAPIQLGANSIGWFEDEIDAWLASRVRVAYAPERYVGQIESGSAASGTNRLLGTTDSNGKPQRAQSNARVVAGAPSQPGRRCPRSASTAASRPRYGVE